MERLTIPDVRINKHTTHRTVIDTEAVRERAMEIYWRLKSYEDTGLTPDQVLNAKIIIESAFSDDTSKAERIREMLIADKDGRVVVLPCKVGDMVWFKTFKDNGKTCIGIQPHNVAGTHVCVMAEGKFFPVELPLGGLGKQWFLTREEAEKALEAKRNG